MEMSKSEFCALLVFLILIQRIWSSTPSTSTVSDPDLLDTEFRMDNNNNLWSSMEEESSHEDSDDKTKSSNEDCYFLSNYVYEPRFPRRRPDSLKNKSSLKNFRVWSTRKPEKTEKSPRNQHQPK